jgi:hypothetical protein
MDHHIIERGDEVAGGIGQCAVEIEDEKDGLG